MTRRYSALIGLLMMPAVVGPTCITRSSKQSTTAPAQTVESDVPPAQLQVEEIRTPEGTLTARRTYYINASGEKVLHGPTVEFYENGKKWREIEYRHGKMNGLLIEYDPYMGEKQREENYRGGLREGLSVSWHDNDRKSSECTYHQDRIVGKRLYWNNEGRLVVEEVYDKRGSLAELTRWYDNGQKASHGRFNGARPVLEHQWIAGKRDGTWTYWDADGNVVAEGQWKGGMPWEGTCIVPCQRGSLFHGEKGTYHHGKLVGPTTGFDFALSF